ncbi:helical backbone metal receptor [uncultured Cohaesibacter sp.]|uniref:helical backbone metal receptor n=1 Tax=uncultured Cohaesibacter sp. TaxID=1002546 RepID=UPI0029C8B6E7|nr:helical backbone metal receptor [uncultured Cohaesibacter sp.]
MLRVISLVPSWTETLIAGGIQLVGRSRYCVHPADGVEDIPIVAGTKDWDWPKIKSLEPDILLLDREENARFMAEQTEVPCHVTHVKSISDMAGVMTDLFALLEVPALEDMASRWQVVANRGMEPWQMPCPLPGLIEWGREPVRPVERIIYLIWQQPWMAVSRDSFIGSLLARLGVEIMTFEEKYSVIDLKNFDPETTLLLFSSEPYPFLRQKGQLALLDFPHAFVDGERIGWYGIRALRFLEAELA